MRNSHCTCATYTIIRSFRSQTYGLTLEAAVSQSRGLYVVQTLPSVIQRCLLMTTDPGDLVLDPTCGSGTTAYVAEQWGRRWITIDTGRVAIALARQRLLTAKYDYYAIRTQASGTGIRRLQRLQSFVLRPSSGSSTKPSPTSP